MLCVWCIFSFCKLVLGLVLNILILNYHEELIIKRACVKWVPHFHTGSYRNRENEIIMLNRSSPNVVPGRLAISKEILIFQNFTTGPPG